MLQQGARGVHELYLSLMHFYCEQMETMPLTRVRLHGNGRRTRMGEMKRLTCMIDDRGIGIAMLLLKGSGRTVCGGGPSRMGGRRVPHPPMAQGRRKVYAGRCLLLSNTHQRFCLVERERRGTNPLAVPGPEVDLRGEGGHSLKPETGDPKEL